MEQRDIEWLYDLGRARAEARRSRRPLVIKPLNQGVFEDRW
jgi:hypothetical protein